MAMSDRVAVEHAGIRILAEIHKESVVGKNISADEYVEVIKNRNKACGGLLDAYLKYYNNAP
jgi:hypothetical protein